MKPRDMNGTIRNGYDLVKQFLRLIQRGIYDDWVEYTSAGDKGLWFTEFFILFPAVYGTLRTRLTKLCVDTFLRGTAGDSLRQLAQQTNMVDQGYPIVMRGDKYFNVGYDDE